ncbi:ABC transporter substrate-binding protein [Roseibium algae]|uniref:ABC transporter substrate-binding protein n=1 Tax=Roseibium algae TaxID=3123038 RepID=A0ABU8TQX3_9HYPH
MSNQIIRPALAALLGIGAVALVAFSVAPQAANATEKTMRIAVPFGPKSSVPDPRARQNGWLSNRAGVSETLIGLGHDMTMQPRLAETFENLSPLEWKLTLRKGVKFHDGSTMTAQDVKASFEKLDQEGHPGHNPRLSRLLGIESITVEGDDTLIFRTKSPNSAFLWSLTEPSAAVLKDGTDELPLIGTGPFVFDLAEPEKTYLTRKFADYWGGEPKLDRIVMDALSDPSVAALALQAGDVDLVTHYPEPDFAALKEKNAGQLFSMPTTRLFFFQVRTADGPLANETLRSAVSLGLDRKTIVAAALNGVGGDVANAIFSASMHSWANTNMTLDYDPEKAKTLLDEAGIKDTNGDGIRELDGEEISLKIRSYEGRAALRPTLEITQALLQQIGISSEISMAEYDANNEALKAGEIDMHLQAWGTAPQGDPDYFPSTLVETGVGYNFSGYSNAELDELLKKGRETFDDEVRKSYYDRVQEIINTELPLIPVFHKTQVSVGNGKVEGYGIHPAETYLVTPDLTFAE